LKEQVSKLNWNNRYSPETRQNVESALWREINS